MDLTRLLGGPALAVIILESLLATGELYQFDTPRSVEAKDVQEVEMGDAEAEEVW